MSTGKREVAQEPERTPHAYIVGDSRSYDVEVECACGRTAVAGVTCGCGRLWDYYIVPELVRRPK